MPVKAIVGNVGLPALEPSMFNFALSDVEVAGVVVLIKLQQEFMLLKIVIKRGDSLLENQPERCKILLWTYLTKVCLQSVVARKATTKDLIFPKWRQMLMKMNPLM